MSKIIITFEIDCGERDPNDAKRVSEALQYINSAAAREIHNLYFVTGVRFTVSEAQ